MARGFDFQGVPGHPGPYDEPKKQEKAPPKKKKKTMGARRTKKFLEWWHQKQSEPGV